MKPFWIGIGTVCVVIAVVAIFYYSGEGVRSYMLLTINVALLQATEDTPDYLEPDGRKLYLRNSISLRTLRDAIKSAEMVRPTGAGGGKPLPPSPPPILYVGKQRIGDRYSPHWHPIYGIWWWVKVSDKYEGLIADYVSLIEKNGEGFGMSLEISRPREEARSYILGIIDEALLHATEDTPDYLDRYGRIHFQNSISLQTLRDALKNEIIWLIVSAPEKKDRVYVIGGQEIGCANYLMLYWEYDGAWCWVNIDGDGGQTSVNANIIQDYISQIETNGGGFGLHLQTSRSREEVKNIMLGIIDETLLNATEDTPDYLDQYGRVRFQNSISLQTLRDALKSGTIRLIVSAPEKKDPIYVIGGQEIGYYDRFYCEYDGELWSAYIGREMNMRFIQNYISQIKKDGEGFGLHL